MGFGESLLESLVKTWVHAINTSMIITETSIPGAFVIDLNKISDDRGFFARAWSSSELRDHGIDPTLTQVNLSLSKKKGTIRGMHFQKAPHEEGKFVRCIRGALYDVILDLREGSPTRFQWAAFELSASNYRAVYVPPGCAHGVQTLEDDTEMFYMVSAAYCREAEGGIRWDDPFFGIQWPEAAERHISEKDLAWPNYAPGS